MTPRSAAVRLHELEQARSRLMAEEALDDPLRMAPHLLSGKAVAGIIIECDDTRRELINGRNCLRPSVTIRTEEPCNIPPGAEVWWTQMPAGREWIVERVAITTSGGSKVTLALQQTPFRVLACPS